MRPLKATGGPKTEDAKRNSDLQMMIRCVDTPNPPKVVVSKEEMARRHEIGRNHVIGQFKQHNDLHHDLACKIKLKRHAIKMIPRNSMWKEEALQIDNSEEGMPPLWRTIPTDFPPIKGLNPDDFIVNEDNL